MAGEAASAITDLPLWIQAALTIGAGVATAIGGVAFGKRGHRHATEREDVAEDFLDASPIKKFLEAVDSIAANQLLQTEALKTISAAATVVAKQMEDDFNEQRINREITRRLGERRRRRGEPDSDE